MKKYLIVATCFKNGIGKNNSLSWNIPEELKYFKKKTTDTTFGSRIGIYMGMNTFKSLESPLKYRDNLVIDRNINSHTTINNIHYFPSIQSCVEYSSKKYDVLWCIGGENIYRKSLNTILFDKIYRTRIYDDYDCDVFFPEDMLKYNYILQTSLYTNNNDVRIDYEEYIPKYHNKDYR